jgi:hypothetical protein
MAKKILEGARIPTAGNFFNEHIVRAKHCFGRGAGGRGDSRRGVLHDDEQLSPRSASATALLLVELLPISEQLSTAGKRRYPLGEFRPVRFLANGCCCGACRRLLSPPAGSKQRFRASRG